MFNPEKEAARGMAYTHAIDVLGLREPKAWRWACDHWPEFLTGIDDDPTAQMLQRAFHKMNHDRQP